MGLLLSCTHRRRMGIFGSALIFVVIALPGRLSAQTPAAKPIYTPPADTNYSGHYKLVDAKAARTFSLDVRQTDSRADVSFSAAMADGSGAAPEGTGKGRVEDGILSFAFKDNFKNEGTCTLELMKDGYHLSMTVIKVADPAPFHFYGNVVLQKSRATSL